MEQDNRKIENLRIPPHSIEAEQAVLGGLMLDNSSWSKISEILLEDHFYRPDHRAIFQIMSELIRTDKPLDVITVSEAIAQKDGGSDNNLAYLSQLAKNTPSAANIKAYATIIKERFILRQLIEAGGDIIDSGFETKGRNALQVLDEAESKVFAIAEKSREDVSTANKGPDIIANILARTVEKIEELYESDDPITGASTGFKELDELTSGFQKADLVIVAGRPSMGKTTLAMNIAEYMGMKTDKSILIFSMEMPSEQLAMRMLSSLGRIELQKLRTGRLTDGDWPRVSSAISMMSEKKILIDDSAALSPVEVRARARRAVKDHGELGVIVLDYLQLMRVPGTSENRTGEISEISRSLKALAKELNVPVIALSQLNRGLEQRPDKRPMMSDLRESGAIEQDADLIIFIYRDEVYNKESSNKGSAEIIVAKQRNGPIGTVKLTFLGQYSRFENYASQHETPFTEQVASGASNSFS
ncbi:MAG: replicative DNA helicase [Francisellaceae bacterium]|jgi:replicative DNA helicase|nr:replicative DNA helicase [Francisellaceae bacterium]MBT6538307.1 replicative DNA helicase [Francisellaceae bacterium]